MLATQQASEAIGTEVLRVIDRFLRVGEVVNCVNLETKSPAKHVIKVRHDDICGVLAAVLTILQKVLITFPLANTKLIKMHPLHAYRIK